MNDLIEINNTFWLDGLPGYSTHPGISELLDITRQAYAEDYYPLLIPFPESMNVSIGGGKFYQGGIRPPVGSLLISIAGDSTQAAGFMFRVYDNATKGDLFSNRFGKNLITALPLATNNYNNTHIGPMYMLSPLPVLSGDGWQITVQNMDNINTAIIQLCFNFAVPKSAGKKIDAMIGK